jgi:acyl-CoA synthetase (AMP-forming)/AMP-acid ligase II
MSIHSFVHILEKRVSETPDHIAYIFLADGEDKKEIMTYAQLQQKIRNFAANIRQEAQPGSRALIFNPPGIDFIVSFLGCFYAGVIPVPLYPPDNHSLRRLLSIAEDCGTNLALANSQIISRFDSIKTNCEETNETKTEEQEGLIKLASNLQLIDSMLLQNNIGNPFDLLLPKRDDTAFLQYTSGSTSKPKGVIVSHYNLVHNSNLINKYFGHTPEYLKVSWLPPFHDMGLIGEVLQCLYAGIPLVFMSPSAFLKKPVRWLYAITNYKHLGYVTSGAPNFAYDFCTNTVSDEQIAKIDLSHWKVAYNGAEPVRASTLENFTKKFAVCGFKKQSFYPVYGLAENTLVVTVPKHNETPYVLYAVSEHLKLNKITEAPVDSADSIAIPSCGHISEEQEIKIVDPEKLCVRAEKEVGEIWIKGDSVAKGYWNNQPETQRVFNAFIHSTPDGPYLRTGDLGFIYQNKLFITGRVKDMIIIRGHNHYPQDIEETVENADNSIRSSCGAAFSIDRDNTESLAIVYEVKRKYCKTIDPETVKANIREKVFQKHGLYAQYIELIEPSTFPKTSSGKLQRQLCKKQFLEGNLKNISLQKN